MSIILKELGCEIVTLDNGRAALAEVRKQLPDLMFLDLLMPKMGGVQVLKELRGDPKLAHLPVVVVSGSSDVEEAFDVRGANEVLTKPFDIEELLRTARRYLSGRPQGRQLPCPSHG